MTTTERSLTPEVMNIGSRNTNFRETLTQARTREKGVSTNKTTAENPSMHYNAPASGMNEEPDEWDMSPDEWTDYRKEKFTAIKNKYNRGQSVNTSNIEVKPITRHDIPIQKSITNAQRSIEGIPDSKSDITQWFNTNEDIKIFSDYEGTTTISQINNMKEIFKMKRKIIYLGDIFDNVNFNDKTFDETKPPYVSNCIKTENYCALKMLRLFIENPDKCRYVVGNRDINKIKLYPLLQFANTEDGQKWWTNGDTYEEIVTNLLNELHKEGKYNSKFLINSMEYYVPFWRASTVSKLDDECGKIEDTSRTIWTTEEGLKIGDLFDRYNKIFGKDCDYGTFSADYTIRGLPNELFKDNINTIIEKIKASTAELFNNIEDFEQKIINEIRAAIVFTVFMRMLDKELLGNNNRNKKLDEVGALDGYLYKYLSNAYPSMYAIRNNNLYLFAHGGITGGVADTQKKFFLNSEKNAFQLLSNVTWYNVFNKSVTDYDRDVDNPLNLNVNLNVIGSKLKMPYTNNNYKNRIEAFNQLYFEYLMLTFKFFNSNKTKHSSLLLISLLSLSAPAENNEIVAASGYTIDLTPIQARLPITSELKHELYGTSNYNNVYNFCGHSSSGMGGYGIRNLKDGTIFVNTDYSTSLFKKDLMCEKETEENKGQNYNSNHLMMTLKPDGKLLVSGQISVPKSQIDSKQISYISTSKPLGNYITINYINTQINNNTPIPNLSDSKTIFYSGVGEINNEDYKIFSDNPKDKKAMKLYVVTKKISQGGGSYKKYKKSSKHSCKNKSCKKRNCKVHTTKKYKNNNQNKSKKYKNKNTKKH